jgi:hypothetical protein
MFLFAMHEQNELEKKSDGAQSNPLNTNRHMNMVEE